MNSRKSDWKSKYIAWYRVLESVFGDEVPHLTDEKIENYVSNEDWIIVPLVGEEDKEDSKKADRPNLFFDLSEKGKISFGITYDKLESVKRLRNIISPFNEKERSEIIEKLASLDDAFRTKVFRKIKKNYWAQSPTYEEVFVEHSNKMNHEQLIEAFKTVDKIMDERNLLEKGKKYQLAPVINIVNVKIDRQENNFKKMLLQTKPIYELTLKLRTREESEKESVERKKIEAKKKQEAFAKYVEELKGKLAQKNISIEEYRTLIMQFQNRQRRA